MLKEEGQRGQSSCEENLFGAVPNYCGVHRAAKTVDITVLGMNVTVNCTTSLAPYPDITDISIRRSGKGKPNKYPWLLCMAVIA